MVLIHLTDHGSSMKCMHEYEIQYTYVYIMYIYTYIYKEWMSHEIYSWILQITYASILHLIHAWMCH